MMKIIRRTLAVLLLACLASPVIPSVYAISEARKVEDAKPYIQWAVTLVLAGACAALMFKNAKRGHQD